MNEIWKKPPVSLAAYQAMVGKEVGVFRGDGGRGDLRPILTNNRGAGVGNTIVRAANGTHEDRSCSQRLS